MAGGLGVVSWVVLSFFCVFRTGRLVGLFRWCLIGEVGFDRGRRGWGVLMGWCRVGWVLFGCG